MIPKIIKKYRVLIFLVLFVSIVIIIKSNNYKETFKSESDRQIASYIYINLKPNMTYEEYLKMVVNSGSNHYNLLEQEVYFLLKALKSRGILTINDIKMEMK